MNKKLRSPKVAFVVALLSILVSYAASASTYHCMNGREVTAGAAAKASLANPNASIIKVQVSKVQLNQDTLRLKKSDDVAVKDICSLIK